MITAHHYRFDESLQQLRLLSARADSFALNPSMRDIAEELRASVLVRCAAENEQLFKNVLTDVAVAVKTSSRTVGSLPPGLRGYLAKTCRKTPQRMSARTASVAEVVSPSMPGIVAELNFSDIAGEGRTIRAHHLSLVWILFGLPGDPFNTAEQVAFNRVADFRNCVAHGDETAHSLNILLLSVQVDLHQTLSCVRTVGSRFASALEAFAASL